jgi:phosphohistidine phosphatase SixA
MKRIWLFPLFLLIVAAVLPSTRSFGSAPPTEAVAPVSVFFVRHAETAASTRTNRDPQLSEGGIARSQDLAELLKNAQVTHLFASEFVRTQSTLKALAKANKLEIEVIPAANSASQQTRLRSLPPGSVAVVCGHSNTVPAMLMGLGGKFGDCEGAPLSEQVIEHGTYHRLFLLTLPNTEHSAPKTIEFQYGEKPEKQSH